MKLLLSTALELKRLINPRALKKWIEQNRCETCFGSGELDDVSPGDISFNTWTCPKCNGTGWKK